MNAPFPPSPGSPAKPQRKLWPWFLGGCLLLVLLAIGTFALLAWFGIKAMSTQARDTVAALPMVQENFGTLTGADFDTSALAQGVLAFSLTGQHGEGRLAIRVNPQTGAFESATLTLPNGEVRELDTTALQRLQALQSGDLSQILQTMQPPPAPPQPPTPPAPPEG